MNKAEEMVTNAGYCGDIHNRAEYTSNDVHRAYIEGYEQAEKNLAFTHITPTDNEKQAAVHYMEDCEEVDDFVRRNIDEIVERYFVAGAKWKEKDLALTWEDVESLCDTFMIVGLYSDLQARSKEFYEKVLSRFNEQRNK